MQFGWESGLIQHWIANSEKRIDKCLLNRNRDNRKSMSYNKQKNLSLTNLSSPFVILLFGLSLSFLVFLVELMWHRFKYHCQLLNAQKNRIDKNNEGPSEGMKKDSSKIYSSEPEEPISEKDIEETIPEGKESHEGKFSMLGIEEILEGPQLSPEEQI